MAADVKYPSVKAGRRRCWQAAAAACGQHAQHDAEEQDQHEARARTWASIVRAPRTPARRLSSTPPRRTAEYMPSGTPISTLRSMATTPSSTVAGRRSQMCSVTGRRREHRGPEIAVEDVLHVDPVLDGQRLDPDRGGASGSRDRAAVALTSSSKWTGLPDSRVRTNTMLITTSMLSSVCSTRPVRYQPHRRLAERVGLLPGHVLPVVEAHVPGNQRPVADLRPHADDGSAPRRWRRRARTRASHGPSSLAHDPHSLLVARLDGQAIDELVELRMLHEQVQRGLRIATRGSGSPRAPGATSGAA